MEVLNNIKLDKKAVLPDELETELANYILAIEEGEFGLTQRDIRSLACHNSLKLEQAPHWEQKTILIASLFMLEIH